MVTQAEGSREAVWGKSAQPSRKLFEDLRNGCNRESAATTIETGCLLHFCLMTML